MLQTLRIYSKISHGQSTRDGPPVRRSVRVEQPPIVKNRRVPVLHCHNRLLRICAHHQLLLGSSDQRGRDRRSMWHARRRREMHAWFWRGNLKERDHLEVPEFKWILWKYDERIRNGLIMLRIGTSKFAVTKRRV